MDKIYIVKFHEYTLDTYKKRFLNLKFIYAVSTLFKRTVDIKNYLPLFMLFLKKVSKNIYEPRNEILYEKKINLSTVEGILPYSFYPMHLNFQNNFFIVFVFHFIT